MTESERTRISELIVAIDGGNVHALDELSRLVSARMLSVARATVRDRALAEDVVQDSFVKIITGAKGFKPNTNGYAWICKIVHNTALKALRRERRGNTVDIDEFFDISDGADISEQASAAADVKRATSALSPIERRLIYQKYFMDFTVRDSAKAVGKSKSQVARLISAAEQKMRDTISRDKTDG